MSGKRVQAPQLQAKITQCLKEHGNLRVSKISKFTGIDKTVIYRNCLKLNLAGKLESIEDEHGIFYSLPDDVDPSTAARVAKLVSHGNGRRS